MASPTTLSDIQDGIAQLYTNMENFNNIVNGDEITTITLPSGVAVPSVRKVIHDIQTVFGQIIASLNSSGGSTNVQVHAQQPQTYDWIVSNPNIDQIITIPNLIVVYTVTLNGLEQKDTDYSRNLNTITLPALNGFNAGDTISISYISSNQG